MKGLFFPYLLAQYPDPSGFSEIFDLALEHADTIEVGIPFTDPVADGPVIANAASQVLAKGFSIDGLFKQMDDRKRGVPIAIMSYANPILAYGRHEFMAAAASCGANHMIVPDVPFEESEDWRGAAKENGLSWISFISLLTGEERLKQIAARAEAFVYLVSVTGITGSTIHNPERIQRKAMQIRKRSSIPIALGFGIKSSRDTLKYEGMIDAFVVGSRIVEIINSGGIEELHNFFQTFRRSS